jgi:hypothetical protein
MTMDVREIGSGDLVWIYGIIAGFGKVITFVRTFLEHVVENFA